MTAAGIDTSIFKPYSSRRAATSASKVADVPLDEIMATSGWRSSSAFAVFSILFTVYLERISGILGFHPRD